MYFLKSKTLPSVPPLLQNKDTEMNISGTEANSPEPIHSSGPSSPHVDFDEIANVHQKTSGALGVSATVCITICWRQYIGLSVLMCHLQSQILPSFVPMIEDQDVEMDASAGTESAEPNSLLGPSSSHIDADKVMTARQDFTGHFVCRRHHGLELSALT